MDGSVDNRLDYCSRFVGFFDFLCAMKRRHFLMLPALGLLASKVGLGKRFAGSSASASPADLRLWYRQPAAAWTEALPIGNGRLAAMVFGGTESE